MLPKVVIHNAVTVDGRLTGFIPDMELYYRLAASFREDLTLSGADTALAGLEQFGEDEGDFAGEAADIAGRLPLFAITDSRGRVREWNRFLKLPFWRGGVSLCSKATSAGHLDYLEQAGVDVIIAGEEHVDLHHALEEIASRYGVETIRTDSGGALNAALLSRGLVDEISLLVCPVLVGDSCVPLVSSIPGSTGVKLTSVEELKDGYVWIRYTVDR